MSKKTKKRKKDRVDAFLERLDSGEDLISALLATSDWRHYDLPSSWTRVK